MPTYVIRHRRDTTANWLAANPILLDGEMGYERTDDGRLLCKMGDGVCGADGTVTGTRWVDLPYCSGPAGPSPEFEWAGTSLRIKNPDGTWGEWTDLQGAQGLQGVQGTPGPTGESVPATRTTLGGVIIGRGLNITAEGCLSAVELNDEEWITESRVWIAPIGGWFEITVWHGGFGGWWSTTLNRGCGGFGVAPRTYLRYYSEGETVPVNVAAGGLGTAAPGAYPEAAAGGITTFGDLPTEHDRNASIIRTPFLHAGVTSSVTTYISGAGAGGANASSATAGAAVFYGAGGAVCHNTDTGASVSNGFQGAVLVRWRNPDKAAGPVATPALFAARRMARAAGPATVNLYDPETGLGSVWPAEDAEATLADGLVSEEAWREIYAARAAEEYAQWLADHASEDERFRMLRAARDGRLGDTDYLVAPDYPLTDSQRAQLTAYRQELRDLPAQEGAPWDGGGAATPWPDAPTLSGADDA